MSIIDTTRAFRAINIALATISDTRTAADDTSGDILAERITTAGHVVRDRRIVIDDVAVITGVLREWIFDVHVDAVVTTGGTGITGRDVTPEAFYAVIEKEITGFGELFRWISFKHIGSSTIQSRALGGVAAGTYLFALPGSSGACRDGWDEILKWQFDSRHRPCNLVELMPRLQER
jgi:molybdenum cofactor biosynthesis protein B